MRIRELLTVTAAALLLSGCAAIPTMSTVEAPAEANAAHVGDAVTVGDWVVTIHSWQSENAAAGSLDIPEYVARASSGMEAAVMDVSLEYVGQGSGQTEDVLIFYIADTSSVPSGRLIPLTTEPSPTALPEGEVRADEQVSGDAYFEIEPDSTGTFRVSAPGVTESVVVVP